MHRNRLWSTLAVAALGWVCASHAAAQTVKVTPLGSHAGEFCAMDRALVFEDPDGTRILYDPGRTVRGPEDARLGKIDAVLLSHVHADHLGDEIAPADNAGTCAAPDVSQKLVPGSNTVNIVVGKKAKLIVGGEMAKFFARKVVQVGGQASQVALLRFGGQARVGSVSVYAVSAAHSNGLDPAFLNPDQAQVLESNGLTAYVGPAGGFVLRFSNGLVAYLSGDTGVMADQDLVVRQHFRATLMVLNIGDTFTTGPVEAAYVANVLVQPRSVIVSHANEQATQDGLLRAGTKTQAFVHDTHAAVLLPLSGHTMAFDGGGACITGCDATAAPGR